MAQRASCSKSYSKNQDRMTYNGKVICISVILPHKPCFQTETWIRAISEEGRFITLLKGSMSNRTDIFTDPGVGTQAQEFFSYRQFSLKFWRCKRKYVKKATMYNVCLVPWVMLSTVESVQYCGGYHEYRGEIS